MTIKAAEQIVEPMLYPRDDKKTAYSLASGVGTLYGIPPGHARHIRAALIAAIEADRAQRENDGTVHAAVIDALEDRRAVLDVDDDRAEVERIQRAVAWIEDEPDEFWEEFAGPMLDEIERKFR